MMGEICEEDRADSAMERLNQLAPEWTEEDFRKWREGMETVAAAVDDWLVSLNEVVAQLMAKQLRGWIKMLKGMEGLNGRKTD